MARAFGIVTSSGTHIKIEGMQQYRPIGAFSFLGRYRVIDFPISNMSNSGIDRIQVYVRNKERACEECGIYSEKYALPAETTQEELLKLIDELNNKSSISGILVQLPVPKHIDESKVLLTIDSTKDVDGFHPVNVGKMVIGEDTFLPCTPAGIIEMIKRTDIDIEGKECVVIGRSNIVGKPMAMLMLKENATVTIAHSRTKDLKEVTKRADIIVAAIGKAKFVTADYVKEGAVVIDVGMDRDENGKLCGRF